MRRVRKEKYNISNHRAVSETISLKMLREDGKSVLIQSKYPQTDDPINNVAQFCRLKCFFGTIYSFNIIHK